MKAQLRITAKARAAITTESVRAFPDEGCGFLTGIESLIDEAHPAPNVHPGPRTRRFRIDGLEYVRMEDALEGTARALVGIFHSHPLHPAVPSETDRETAWPGLAYLIQEVREGREPGELRAWRLRADRSAFEAAPLHLDGGPID